MGRQLKRVALDFNWPLNLKWHGYVNPHYRECETCNGTGETASSSALGHLVHLLLTAGENSLERPDEYTAGTRLLLPNYHGAPPTHVHHFPHPWLLEAGVDDPGSTMHELTAGLCGRSLDGRPLGHDCCDKWSAVKKIRAAAGLPEDWGTCKSCDGDGIDPSIKTAYEAWKKVEPPQGEGYQLWENTSEGSPISPVLNSMDELAEWCAGNATTFADIHATADQWKKMFNDDLIVADLGGGNMAI